jgi:predicted ATPase
MRDAKLGSKVVTLPLASIEDRVAFIELLITRPLRSSSRR